MRDPMKTLPRLLIFIFLSAHLAYAQTPSSSAPAAQTPPFAIARPQKGSLVACNRSSDSTKSVGAPGWQGGNRSNTSGIARIFNAASRDAPTGDCFRNFGYRPLGNRFSLGMAHPNSAGIPCRRPRLWRLPTRRASRRELGRSPLAGSADAVAT